MIRFENITKSYGDNRVIADLNFEIAKGEFFVLIGPSGSGKTTTLKMINRLITPSQGDIYLKRITFRYGLCSSANCSFPQSDCQRKY